MPRGQPTLPIGPIRNTNLFSNHWLEQRLPREPEWNQLRDEAAAVLDELGQLWRRERDNVAKYSEGGLEQAFIQQVLEKLGWTLIYQTHLRGGKPDYALFLDRDDKSAALRAGRKNQAFWDHASVVADAKAWETNLDRPTTAERRREYPPEQIERYIQHSGLPYGMLTNGRLWRLYPHDLSPHQRRFETYLECDLEAILEAWRKPSGSTGEHAKLIDNFLRFYLFFSPVAFRTPTGETSILERAAKGSNEYRLGVGEGLKDRVFKALRYCIDGFLAHPPNDLTDNDLPSIKEQSLVLLYRLLFIMYAEDRDLLPYRSNRTYRDNRSLSRLRDDLASQIDAADEGRGQDLSHETDDLWGDLCSLFDLIDSGRRRYGVPAYNGGLFDPKQSPFLANKVLSDWSIARVIDQLSRAQDKDHPGAGLFRVDYRDLSIQHLGHMYEGLLELRPQRASRPMLEIRKATRQGAEEKIVPLTQGIPKGFREIGRIEKGGLYLATDKGERRSTGSYYTPNHIVDYIVENTLGPLCQQIDDALAAEIEETKGEIKRRRGRNRKALQEKLARLEADFDDRVLQLSILDPAMGSGHFLLRACQYLAEEIATNPNSRDPQAEQLDSDESTLTFWKRRIVEHCLYGVDINPLAVELAKVALWLETASRSEPLTFLDHHLRCGNSLVGGWVTELGSLPGAPPAPLFEQTASSRLGILLEGIKQITETPSHTAEQVKRKAKLYQQQVDKVRQPLVAVADLWCASFYLDKAAELSPDQYSKALESLGSRPSQREVAKKDWFRRALEIAHRPDVACFHWELEFPEVFFDLSGRREEAGFDAIIGNPPYDVLSEKETGHDLKAFRAFLKAQPMYEPSFLGKNNLYKLFVCLALSLLREGGRMGFITPMAVLGDKQAADIRRRILELGAFTSIDAFPQKDDPDRRVFREAKLSTAVFTLVKTEDDELKAEEFVSRIHPAQFIEIRSPSLKLSTKGIPLYDPSNLTIVSCSQEDWDLAIKITGGGRMVRLHDFAEFFQGEINETNEKRKGTIRPDPSIGSKVLRASGVCLYCVRDPSQSTTGDFFVDVQYFLDGKSPTAKAFYHREPRVGVQGNAPQNNFRRLIAAPIEPDTFCFYTINFCPQSKCDLPLDFLLALLNSKLCEWYFRLGSTNAHANQYNLSNLPCPRFRTPEGNQDKEMRDRALAAIRRDNIDGAFEALMPGTAAPPFSPAVRDVTVALVRRIIQAEQARGRISRAERSSLCPKAQPYQDLIDRLMYAMAGLTDAEARGLEDRLANML